MAKNGEYVSLTATVNAYVPKDEFEKFVQENGLEVRSVDAEKEVYVTQKQLNILVRTARKTIEKGRLTIKSSNIEEVTACLKDNPNSVTIIE